MRDNLAARVLDHLVDWEPDDRSAIFADLARLARYKYDHYEGFSAGERFFARLARWLSQFETMEDRRRIIDFVRNDLLFISRDEMIHAITCVYSHHIKHLLIRQAAILLDLPAYKVTSITGTPEFSALRRKTLFLGLSDGARLDLLRRSSHELSHEQFSLSAELGDAAQSSMIDKLSNVAERQNWRQPHQFSNVVLVDDFYGSGASLLDQRTDGTWKGKLYKAQKHLIYLAGVDPPVVIEDPTVIVVIYVASHQARCHVKSMLSTFEPDWRLIIVQELPAFRRVDNAHLHQICKEFFDPVMADEHKGTTPHGHKDASLPVVLFHNTPNNSISILWADTESQPGSSNRCALFPRYERHHADRP